MSDDTGMVITVDGPIDPDSLGITLTHEHIFIDLLDAWYDEPKSAYKKKLANEPVSIDNLWFVRRNMMGHKDNMVLDSYKDSIDELTRFIRAGGSTVVDVTPKGIGGDPEMIQQISHETEINFVQGTAFYVQSAHPSRISSMTQEEIENEFISDVQDGIDKTSVRAGVIGEIGLSEFIHSQEEKVLRAGARAAQRTGAPMSIHPPGRSEESQQDGEFPTSRWALEILDIIEEEGLDPNQVIMCHMDRSLISDPSYQKQLAERGAYIEYDLWGMDNYLDQFNDSYQSDGWRVEAVTELLEAGYESKILFSHDIAFKISLAKYGGYGYGHILENVVPMLRNQGIKQEQINKILVDNPRQILQFGSS